MENTVFEFLGREISMSSVVIALGILAWFMLSYSLFITRGGNPTAMWLTLAVGTVLSVLFSRFIHWYCHSEQYVSMWKAITDYSIGSYCLPGVLLGVLIAGCLPKLFGLTKNTGRLFDCLAPGAALGFALFKLSSLFNTSCRAKIAVTAPLLQHLPIAATINLSSGSEYRFATFYVQFLLLLVMCACLLKFFFKRRRFPMKGGMPRDGHVAFMFLLWYSALELIGDSTRYDSSFVRSNGFVSLVQIVAALCILAILIIYSVRSVRVNRLKVGHFLAWIGFLLGVGIVGVSEYLVQRHGNWYLSCYFAMLIGVIIMALIPVWLYHSVCADEPRQHEERPRQHADQTPMRDIPTKI